MGYYPILWAGEAERYRFLYLEDLEYFRENLLGANPFIDFIGWEFKDGKVLLIHPWVQIYNSTQDINLWPGATMCIQTIQRDDGTLDYMPPEYFRPKKKWWQFWK